MKRGIIAAPGKIDLSLTGVTLSPNLSAEDVRFFLMYWDKIIIPTNNIVHFSIPDEKDLVESGAIFRPNSQMTGSFHGNQIGTAIITSQFQVAEQMMKDKSTDWVLHQFGENIYYPDGTSRENNIIRLTLANTLPVPSSDVNINEILEFKERRKTELSSLHEAMDEFYLEILKSPDKNLETAKATKRFQQSIIDLNNVSAERFKKTGQIDLSTEFSLNGKDMIQSAAVGAIIDFLTPGHTIPIATVISTLVSCIKISIKSTKTFKHAEGRSKLAYLSRAKKEGLIQNGS